MLKLEVGDVVTIYKEEGEWFEGECKGAIGYVPKSFVREDSVPTPRTPEPSPQPDDEPLESTTTRPNTVVAHLDKALLALKLQSSPRTLAAIELVETERRYVEDLQILEHAILAPLQRVAAELNESKGFVDHLKKKLHAGENEHINMIVAQWGGVCGLNVPFLAALQGCVQTWHNLSEKDHVLGPVLMEHLPKFDLYGKYCAQYYSIQRILTRILALPGKFSRVRKNAEESGLLQNRTLGSYLISPIQRVPRYQMLLGELLKCTPAAHADYPHIQESLRIVMEVGKAINESVRIQENHELIMKLESTFDSSPHFSSPTRELIRHGELTKSTEKNPSDSAYDPRRTFFLFNDMLAYARIKAGDKLTLRGRLALNSSFEIVESGDPYQITIKSKKLMSLLFRSAEDKTNWLNDLQQALAAHSNPTKCGVCHAALTASSLTQCVTCFAFVCASCYRVKSDQQASCLSCQDFNKTPVMQRKASSLGLRSFKRPLTPNSLAPNSPASPVPNSPASLAPNSPVPNSPNFAPNTPSPTMKDSPLSSPEPEASPSSVNGVVLDCPQGHGLSLQIALQEGYVCDACGLGMEIGERMQSCVACDFFVCVRCQQRSGVTLKAADNPQQEIDAMILKARTGFLDRFIQGGSLEEEEEPRPVPTHHAPELSSVGRKFSLRDLRQKLPYRSPSPLPRQA